MRGSTSANMRSLTIGVHVTISCVLLSACSNRRPISHADERVEANSAYISTDYVPYYPTPNNLLPEDRSRAVVWKNVPIDGSLSTADLAAITHLLGRIPRVDLTVKRVDAVWEMYTAAAEIVLSESFVFCVKDSEGRWSISRMIHFQRSP